MFVITSFHISPFTDSVLSHGGSRTPSGLNLARCCCPRVARCGYAASLTLGYYL